LNSSSTNKTHLRRNGLFVAIIIQPAFARHMKI